MAKSWHAVSFAAIFSGGLLFHSFSLTNPLNPFFPSPSLMQEHRQALQQRTAKSARIGHLAKRQTPGSASVSGTVTLLDPLASQPDIIILDTFGYQVAQVTSDDTGTYGVSGLFPGSYLVFATTGSYSFYGDGSDRTYLGNTTDASAAQWIRLSAGQTLTNQNITIAASLKKGVTISGTCYLGPGTALPPANTYVSFRFVSADQTPIMSSYFQSNDGYCYTNADGTFRCSTGVAPGNYYVLISSMYVQQWWNGSTILMDPVAASIPNSVTGKVIHFDTGGSISGSVKDNGTDSLLSYVTIYLIDKDGFILTQRFVYSGNTDFTFSGILPGSYFLKTIDNSGAYVTTYYPQALFRDSATALSLASGAKIDSITIALKLIPGYSASRTGLIKGTITRSDNGTAISNMDVGTCSVSGMPGSSTTSTDTLGSYQESVAADSSVLVYAGNSLYQFGGGSPDYYLAQTYYPGTTDKTAATSVTVGANATITINISVQQGGSLAGLLRTSSNARLPAYYQALFGTGAIVYGYAWTADFKNIYGTGSTDLSGFRFAGVNPGTYTMRFLSYGYDYYNMATTETDYGCASAKNVVVTKENTAFGQTIILPDGSARITGAVASGAQVNGANITHELCCYGTDSIIVGIAQLSYASKTNSLKALFFSRDDVPVASGPAQSNYSLGKLAPGSYALAHMTFNSTETVATREWYGVKKVDTLNTSDYNTYLKQFLKPNIPSTSWLTLTAGETKANVDFGNVGVIMPSGQGLAHKPSLRFINNPGQNKALIHYRLSGQDLKNKATLTVFRINGACVRTFILEKPAGVVVWDRHDDRNAPVTAGVYVFRLTSAGSALAVKGIVSK
jgi:hypothetical protein